MNTKLFKTTTLALAVLMISSMLGACKKDGDEELKVSGSAAKSTTAAISAAKTTAKATDKSAATASTSTERATDEMNIADTDPDENRQYVEAGDNSQQSNQDGERDESVSGGQTSEVKEEKPMDLGGRTITLSYYSDFTGNSSETVMKRLFEIAEEKYNFKLEWIKPSPAFAQYITDLLSATIAGVKFADIITASTVSHYLPLMKAKAVTPLDDYVDFEDPVIKAFDYLYNLRHSDGKHYFFTPGPAVALGSGSTPYNLGDLMFNADILEREGQPNILDLYEDRQWDWNAFLNIALACTRDIDGDGVIDQWGVSSQASHYALQHIYHSNGILPAEMLSNGKFALNVQSVRAQKCLQFLSDLNFVHKVYLSKSGTTNYIQGKVAMFLDYGWQNKNYLASGINTVMAPLPLGPDVSNPMAVVNPTLYGILATNESPAEVARVLRDTMISWDENMNLLPELQEIVDGYAKPWDTAFAGRCTTSEREYRLNFEFGADIPIVVDYMQAFPNFMSKLGSLLATPVMDGKMSPSQAADSAEAELQAIIDEFN